MTQLLRVHNFMLSSTATAPAEGHSLEARSATPTRWPSAPGPSPATAGPTARPRRSRGLDDYMSGLPPNIGAAIMGLNKFSPHRAPGRPRVAGLVGARPALPHPRVRLTHHLRPSSLADTTFHFIDASPADALAQAKAAADGKDVRLGGGVHTVREFLDADLVDTLHVAVAPIDLGRGERLWGSPDELLDRYHCDRVPSPSGVTHLLFWRR